MAVVLAQTASEQCTEWSMATCFDIRGSKDLTGPVLELLRPLDVCNDRIRRLYSVLTGDSPKNKPFWKQLKAHAKRRHDVVHRGIKVSAEQAEESVTVVEQYVLHAEAAVAGAQTKRHQNM
jgi:hypothetical protein